MLFLIIVLIFCLIKIKEIKSFSEKEKSSHLKIIEQTEKLYQKTLSEKNDIQKKNKKHEEQILELKKEIEHINRKLEFYKNIEKDSGDLNFESDKEDHKQLVEEAVSYLKSKKNIEEEIDSSPNMLGSLLDEEQTSIWNEIESQNKNFFITGKAGTGKSFLLDVFRKATDKKYIVLAPTGIAALNVGSTTQHMILGIVIGIIGFTLCGINYPIYKKMLEKGKQKYAFEIVQLAREIADE